MIINYNIGEDDYLTHQLYVASKSDRVKNARLRSKVIAPICFIIFAIIYLNEDNLFMTISFSIIAVLWFFFYPLRERDRYTNHYRNFIKETYKGTFDRILTLEFTNDYIFSQNNGIESKVPITEIEEINEINNSVFIKLKTGGSFLLPKSKIKEIDQLIIKLQEIAKSQNIKYNFENKWKWK